MLARDNDSHYSAFFSSKPLTDACVDLSYARDFDRLNYLSLL